MKEFELEGDFIKLDQLLKAVSFASSGGEAKILILSELIKVNDQVATQRGKKSIGAMWSSTRESRLK